MSVENNFEITKTIVCTSWHVDKLYNFSNEFIGYFYVTVIDRTMKLNKISKNILMWSINFYEDVRAIFLEIVFHNSSAF